jgi:peptidoglycan lytic transglycosylase
VILEQLRCLGSVSPLETSVKNHPRGKPIRMVAFLTSLVLLLVGGCSSSVQSAYARRTGRQHSRLAMTSLGADEASGGAALGPTQVVDASWYGPGYAGRRTASGDRFDPNRLTAASKTLPLGSRVRVTNPANGKTAQVKITDRGPAVRGRALDLSPAAAHKLGLTRGGVAPVEITPLSER